MATVVTCQPFAFVAVMSKMLGDHGKKSPSAGYRVVVKDTIAALMFQRPISGFHLVANGDACRREDAGRGRPGHSHPRAVLGRHF